jgi:MFS family permease
MPRVVTRAVLEPGDASRLLEPRDGLILERQVGEGRFEAAEGPVHEYERVVEAVPSGDAGAVEITETVRFVVAMGPPWSIVATALVKRWCRREAAGRAGTPWWGPPGRLDARGTAVLGALCTASLVTGYLGTLLTQTLTFAADEFDVGDRGQGVALASVRVAVIFALLMTTLADRRGRRRVIVVALALGCVSAATGAAAPSLPWLAVSQTVSRSFSTALALLIAVVVAEEMPRRSRAYGLSLLIPPAALGAGMCLWILPVADLGERGWRIVYLVPLLGLLVVPSLARLLPESRRFGAPHARASMSGHGRRFWLLAVGAFLVHLQSTPASQFQNEFLRDERGFSAAMISLFTVSTATPASIGLIIGGRLAETRGRRKVGAAGTVVEAIGVVLTYAVAGPLLWVFGFIWLTASAARAPAMGIYGSELFPTALRGRAAGLLAMAGVTGSASGLVAAGWLSDELGGLGDAMLVLAVGPLLLAVLVIVRFPETAGLELEELNPEDRASLATPSGDRVGQHLHAEVDVVVLDDQGRAERDR